MIGIEKKIDNLVFILETNNQQIFWSKVHKYQLYMVILAPRSSFLDKN